MQKLQLGIYRHYRGNRYLVLGIAKHSETQDDLVIYTTLYENKKSALWARPIKMFLENVIVDGKEVPRFKKMD